MMSYKNDRHEKHGKSYVPVKWSNGLKEQSKVWANKLASDCNLEHDPKTDYGENIALNYGWGSWSARRPTENILTSKCFKEIATPDISGIVSLINKSLCNF